MSDRYPESDRDADIGAFFAGEEGWWEWTPEEHAEYWTGRIDWASRKGGAAARSNALVRVVGHLFDQEQYRVAAALLRRTAPRESNVYSGLMGVAELLDVDPGLVWHEVYLKPALEE